MAVQKIDDHAGTPLPRRRGSTGACTSQRGPAGFAAFSVAWAALRASAHEPAPPPWSEPW